MISSGRFLASPLSLAFLAAACPHVGDTQHPNSPRADAALEIEVIPHKLFASSQIDLQGESRQLLFHVNLRNTSQRALQIHSVELTALDKHGSVLSTRTLERTLLRKRLRGVGWIVMRDRQTIAAAHRYRGRLRRAKGDTTVDVGTAVSLPHIHTVFRPESVPARIRLTVRHDTGEATTLFGVEPYSQKTRLTLPVKGRWWVMAGHRHDEYHGSAILNSQNFAYDLGVVGVDQTTSIGDPTQNQSYLANGRPILAAADGEVVTVHDGVAENTPVGARPDWQSILRQPLDVAGNHVVVEHGQGEYTGYMHLRPGLKVKVGQRVERGQVIGLCGNSGNSLETHLHFQFQDGPDSLTANGLPPRFSDFTIHLAHLKLYVPADGPVPLPHRLTVEPGRAEGAVDISKVVGR